LKSCSKIVIVSTYNYGGAGKAAFRLHEGLRESGCESRMLVCRQSGGNHSVVAALARRSKLTRLLGPDADRMPAAVYAGRAKNGFSSAWFPSDTASRITSEGADVVNLHWINDGYLNIESIAKLRRPIVWTLHDLWPFTGGCHYAGECRGFESKCGDCPQLSSNFERDLSRWNMYRKTRSWRPLPVTIVTPSRWLADTARKSSLFRDRRIEVIPNGIDLKRFSPIDRNWVRNILGIDNSKQWLLFGAWGGTDDPRKGFDLLRQTLAALAEDNQLKNRLGLLTFGSNRSEREPGPFPTKNLGELNDEVSLALAYNAADVFVAPSREDNLPNTIVEALACGIPCVAFEIGGMPDLIDHRTNGYLADAYSTEELAEGIKWLLLSPDRLVALKQNARWKAEKELGLDLQASRYISLFNEVLQ
jgi:glycosyltransferase involved in cell wall biosynthesis